MAEILKMFINGVWTQGAESKARTILNPATGQGICEVAEGGSVDVDTAVDAARKAFDEGPWGSMPALQRASRLFRLADALDAHAEELAKLETANNGKPLRESVADVADAANCFRYYAGLATKPHGQTYDVPDPMQAMVVREPVGVCGLIVPWNYPLLMAVWKLAPALAAGNCVVFKPAEATPLTTIRLFELMEPLDFPVGVINLVLGAGETVGARIAEHSNVDKIAFTGGTDTGRLVMKAAAGNIKKLSLELGGKSPCIVFADADLETAVDWALFAIFANQGQVCSAGSRLLLEDSIHDRFVERLAERASQIVVGPGDDPASEMGPLITEEHMCRVLAYIDIGVQEGARLLCGGSRIRSSALASGFYVQPTIFTECRPEMRIVREEIFGPVLSVLRFSNEAEAVRLANDSPYGLAGGVFSQDGARALRVIRKLRAGITWINCYHPTYNEAPWGGYKQSGIGRELGTYGFDAFTEIKQINVNLAPGLIGWYQSH
ncbi:MAG TPA: aldehyde dehydrogenase family protein [Fibrobacteraceae bacterium]|nr:aldehyde dehydrogenase family protein [Fibrobacteraceae bacterium]